MRVPSSRIFKCDYKNLQDVCALAKSLGKGMSVVKHPDRDNYNITHTSRTDLYHPSWVVFNT